MLLTRLAGWIRPALALLATAGMLTLTACGGGSGAPNNPYAPPPVVPGPLTVAPAKGNIAHAGTPLVLSISGGVMPYFAFSSNPAALPTPQNVSGNTLTLLANNVEAEQPANITIRDSTGAQATAEVVVRPSLLLPASITITPNGAPCSGGEVCSGQTSVAVVRVTGANGGGVAGRSVRFDVVQGTFSLQTTNPGSPQASTQTVVSDANGEARVIIAVPPNTPTQIGLLRATELQSGSQVTSQFVIQQVTDGTGVLSIAPSGQTTIKGPAQGVCSSGVRVSHYIFGGTPPYQVRTNFPGAVALVGVPVMTNGGGFDIITNGTCFQNLTFVVTDATGRTVTTGVPTVTNEPGDATGTTPAVPLQVSAPGAGSSTTPLACRGGTTVPVIITGTPPFSGATTGPMLLSPNPVSASPGTMNVSFPPGFDSSTLAGVQTYSVTIGDGSTPQQLATVTIYCD